MAPCFHHGNMNEDLWVDILKRVPIRTLGQFRCVCKSWNSMISSSYFITTHHSFTPPSHETYIFIGYFTIDYRILEHPLFYAFCNINEQPRPRFFHVPIEQPPGASFLYRTIGVIHGVVCLERECQYNKCAAILWNPSISKYVEIHPSTQHQQWRRVLGFGFNSRMNEFKVIIEANKAFEVFSTRQGNWKSINSDNIASFKIRMGGFGTIYSCFTDNNIHWIVERRVNREKSMLVFDCESDEFKILDFPKEINGLGSWRLDVKPSSGKLSVVQVTKPGLRWRGSDEWVMENSTWKKLSARDKLDDVLQLGLYGCDFEEWSRRPGNSYLFRPSLFLMDWKAEGNFICALPRPYHPNYRHYLVDLSF